MSLRHLRAEIEPIGCSRWNAAPLVGLAMPPRGVNSDRLSWGKTTGSHRTSPTGKSLILDNLQRSPANLPRTSTWPCLVRWAPEAN